MRRELVPVIYFLGGILFLTFSFCLLSHVEPSQLAVFACLGLVSLTAWSFCSAKNVLDVIPVCIFLFCVYLLIYGKFIFKFFA